MGYYSRKLFFYLYGEGEEGGWEKDERDRRLGLHNNNHDCSVHSIAWRGRGAIACMTVHVEMWNVCVY